jgi:hypothetical protein
MFFLWLAINFLSEWSEGLKEKSMNYVLQELEKQGEAPLTEFMDSIFAKRKIPYDTQKEYFAVFERVGLIEMSEGKIRLKKKEEEQAGNIRSTKMQEP